MIDKAAFRSMSYGVYIISSQAGDKRAGCVVNTLVQVTSAPPQLSVAVNKENMTANVIAESGRFNAVVLSETATMELIGTFGFKSSADIDKFADCSFAVDAAGVPYVNEQCVARFSARVVNQIDAGTHIIFIGEVEEAETLRDDAPMTYAYYHQVKGGKTPPKASSFSSDALAKDGAREERRAEASAAQAKSRTSWVCTICGHVEYADELPDDYVCPLCGMGKEFFEKVEA